MKRNKKGVLMMSVIDNGRIGSIKKQIFLSLGLFFSWSQLGAMCPQTVGSMSINEGIWNVLTRVGAATNVIESQICAISGSAADCIQFGQSDIGAGGVYTISSPGVYCMYEDAAFTTGPAITVNSSDVTIDMKGHTLDASNSANSGIQITGGKNNVIIQNGSIENLNQSTGVGGIIDDGSGIMMQNIIIQDMNFNITGGATSIAGINFGATAVADIFTNVLVENCQATNGFIVMRSGLSAVVRGCVLTCDQTSGNASILIAGRAATNSLLTAVIEDCVIKNVAARAFGVVGSAIFDVENALAVSISNCQSYGSTSQGVNIVNVVDVAVSDCVVQRSALDAYNFSAAIIGISLISEVRVDNCVAQSQTAFAGIVSGFLFQSSGAAGFKSIVVTDCVAEDYGVGFFVTNLDIGKTIQPHFRNCYANANGFGFLLGPGSDPATALILHGSLVECTASNNSIYGFLLGVNSQSMDIVRCRAIGNASDGYNVACITSYFETYASGNTGFGINDLGSPGGANTYVGCRAHGNIAGNYAGGLPNISVYPAGPLTYMNNLSA